jgi:hypothetical protein
MAALSNSCSREAKGCDERPAVAHLPLSVLTASDSTRTLPPLMPAAEIVPYFSGAEVAAAP